MISRRKRDELIAYYLGWRPMIRTVQIVRRESTVTMAHITSLWDGESYGTVKFFHIIVNCPEFNYVLCFFLLFFFLKKKN